MVTQLSAKQHQAGSIPVGVSPDFSFCLTPSPFLIGIASGLALSLAQTVTGFNSPRFHSIDIEIDRPTQFHNQTNGG